MAGYVNLRFLPYAEMIFLFLCSLVGFKGTRFHYWTCLNTFSLSDGPRDLPSEPQLRSSARSPGPLEGWTDSERSG